MLHPPIEDFTKARTVQHPHIYKRNHPPVGISEGQPSSARPPFRVHIHPCPALRRGSLLELSDGRRGVGGVDAVYRLNGKRPVGCVGESAGDCCGGCGQERPCGSPCRTNVGVDTAVLAAVGSWRSVVMVASTL